MDRVAIQKELERIRAHHGGVLHAEDVVAEAAAHNSVLHSHFEWDDKVAGPLYRIHQARHLIKIVVVPIQISTETVVIPFYVSEGLPGGGYSTVVDVMSDRQRTYNNTVQAITRVIGILTNCPHPVTKKLAHHCEKVRAKLKP